MDLALTLGNDLLAHTAMSEGDVPPLRNWILFFFFFLKLELCNLVNTFGCKHRTGDEKKYFLALNVFWENIAS